MDEPQLSRLRTPVFALLSVVTVGSLVGTALAPYLLVKSPLLLVVISAAAHHIVLAAASVDPVPLVVIATVRRVLTCVGAYGLGFLYGREALGWLDRRYPRLARFVGWLELLFARWGVWLLVPAPAPSVALLAGAGRSRFLAFLIAVTLGQALWISATVYVGDALAVWTDLLTTYLGEHLLESTLVCLVLVALQQAFSRRTRRRKQAGLPLPPS